MPGMKPTMEEYKAGKLHSGSKSGPVVKSRKQAIAIGLSEERKAGEHVAPKHHDKHHPHHDKHHAEYSRHISEPHGEHGGHVHAQHPVHPMHEHAGTHEGKHPHKSHTHHGEHYMERGEHAHGHPGHHLRMDHDGAYTIGEEKPQGEPLHKSEHLGDGQYHSSGREAEYPHGPGGYQHSPLKLNHSAPHGFGHTGSQKKGGLRLSGHPGAHQLGKRK